MSEPPHDYAAERAVLGSMLLSRTAIAETTDLRGADFYRPQHETVFDTITDLYASGKPVDPITVADDLHASGALNRVGGAEYLHTLISDPPPITVNAAHYARIVRDKAVLRRLMDAGNRIVQMAAVGEGEVAAVLDRAQAAVLDAVPHQGGHDYAPVGEFLDAAVDAIEQHASNAVADTAIPTGFLDLDDLLTGYQPGQMIVIAGRPGLGKSTLAMDHLRAASMRNGLCSVIFSLEMNRQEIVTRLLSAEAKVPLKNLRSGQLNDGEWARLALAHGPISTAPLFIDDSPNLTMTEIRAKARRLRSVHGLRLIVIDYLQLMSSGKSVESRQVEVSEFSRQIKLLAKELQVPVIALSQLNRGPEQRTSKRPVMSDLRESGSIEQDADVVILLHRDDAYELESTRPGEADLIVAKQRNGPTADVPVAAQLHFSRFANLGHE